MFDCMLDECPRDTNKCHLWWEIPWENHQTGEVTFKKGCILSQEMGLPIVQSIVKAAHQASEHSSVARNTFEYATDHIQAMLHKTMELSIPNGQEDNNGQRAIPTESE